MILGFRLFPIFYPFPDPIGFGSELIFKSARFRTLFFVPNIHKSAFGRKGGKNPIHQVRCIALAIKVTVDLWLNFPRLENVKFSKRVYKKEIFIVYKDLPIHNFCAINFSELTFKLSFGLCF